MLRETLGERRVVTEDSISAEDHSGNDPQLIPSFLCPCSEMFPERFRSVSVSVGSKEIRLF